MRPGSRNLPVPVPVTIRQVALLALAVVTVDQLTKALARAVADGSSSGPLVPVRNADLALGIAGGPLAVTVLLAAVGIVAVGGYVVHRAWRGLLPAWIPAFLVGGATSNLLDRLAAGAVHDFLATPWVVFNLADLAVLAGVIGWTALTLTRLVHPREGVTP